MAHEWHRGVLTASSWHGLEEVGVMADAEAQIDAGERTGAWPVAMRMDALLTASGLTVPAKGAVATYRDNTEVCLGTASDRYRPTTPDQWRDLCRAAVAAGAKPTGAFSLRDGTRVLATFEVGVSNGLRSNLLLVDSFDGTLSLHGGTTSVRVVCANTLAMAFDADASSMAKIRHTASLTEKAKKLEGAIAGAIKNGETVRSMYAAAEQKVLDKEAARKAFDALFPEAEKDATQAQKTKAENLRNDAMLAAAMPINKVGNKGTLATLWNAATYLVDRESDGSARKTRASSPLDTLLFGSRGERVREIQTLIEVILKDGTVQTMTAPQAVDVGVDPRLVGKKVLEDMLADA